MSLDPMKAVIQYLRSLPDLPPGSITGSLRSREVGDTTIYVYLDNGYRAMRDVLDRIYVAYEVYSLDQEEAAELSLLVREHFLRGLRHVTIGDRYFLDCLDEEYPNYEPDDSSREHVYCGVVSLYLTEA